jgi:6-pyruvoyltetrahydropterin/6-carboxytetrahydropterin synthase
MFRIRKSFTFEAAHRLLNHDGKCRNLHGHSYKVEVFVERITLQTDGPKQGMVLDFTDLKTWWKPLEAQLDHATILQEGDPLLNALAFAQANPDFIMTTLWPPTAENLADWLVTELKGWLDNKADSYDYLYCKVRVWETTTSWAESDVQ